MRKIMLKIRNIMENNYERLFFLCEQIVALRYLIPYFYWAVKNRSCSIIYLLKPWKESRTKISLLLFPLMLRLINAQSKLERFSEFLLPVATRLCKRLCLLDFFVLLHNLAPFSFIWNWYWLCPWTYSCLSCTSCLVCDFFF